VLLSVINPRFNLSYSPKIEQTIYKYDSWFSYLGLFIYKQFHWRVMQDFTEKCGCEMDIKLSLPFTDGGFWVGTSNDVRSPVGIKNILAKKDMNR
jgi:hypothetical protein